MRRLFPLICLLFFSGLLYFNSLNNDFVRTESWRAREDKSIQSLKNVPAFFTIHYWLHEPIAYKSVGYRPLRQVSFTIDYFLYKDNPRGWKLTNVLLNMINVILIYFFVLRLFQLSTLNSQLLAFLTALLFAAHPVHTESINWLKNRTDLICSIFFLLSVILFLKSVRASSVSSNHPTTQSPNHLITRLPGHQVTSYLLSLLFFLLALWGKEIALSLPLLLSGYILLFHSAGKYDKQFNFLSKQTITLPFWGIALLYIFLYRSIFKSGAELTYLPDLSTNILIVFQTVGFNIKKVLFPINLCVDPRFSIPQSIFSKGRDNFYYSNSPLYFICSKII